MSDAPSPDPARELDRLTLALVPIRAFLGATFVYAGMDKLIDPTFLQTTGPGSIGAQLDSFVRVSPIGPLIHLLGQPFPVAIGLLIAVAEIAIGLGALTGLLFRLAAAGGFALSILFWLTASWAIKPYYYGPDLPYALGWLTLALAGTGGRFTIETWLDREFDGDVVDEPVSPERRLVLKAGVLGLAAVAMAGLAGTVGASLLGRQRTGIAGSTSPDAGTTGAAPTDAISAPAAGSPAATDGSVAVPTQAPASGPVVARVSQLASGRAVSFDDPITGDPGVVIRLRDGRFVAYDTVCTHAGCTVGYDRASGYLICPCHGAAFDPADHAAVIAGPTDQPLTSLPIHVDSASGRITLAGSGT
ncbi:MAG TPA: Rieske 2Fe-2S domain-containing protein [Candidatus Limnocylindrales bacterium]|nr:Rieske 2Fe-2S domain-containing protein [Candidatus Limnocylindrales bacterium]